MAKKRSPKKTVEETVVKEVEETVEETVVKEVEETVEETVVEEVKEETVVKEDVGTTEVKEVKEDVGTTEVENPAFDKVLNNLGNSFGNLAEGFKNSKSSITLQKVLFQAIKNALSVVPHKVPDKLLELAEKHPEVVDGNALRHDNDWEDYNVRGAYNALISMLAIKTEVIEPHFQDSGILKSVLSPFGDNGYYLASLHTEV